MSFVEKSTEIRAEHNDYRPSHDHISLMVISVFLLITASACVIFFLPEIYPPPQLDKNTPLLTPMDAYTRLFSKIKLY